MQALMISYSLENPAREASRFAAGFKLLPTNDVELIARCISSKVWSPIRFEDGRRRQDHFVSAYWAVLDFDDGEMSLADALNTWCDTVHIIGTTKSHRKDKGGHVCDRFRVLLKMESRVDDLMTYRYNMVELMKHYPADKSCKDGARFFYPCKEIVSIYDSPEAYLHEVVPCPSWYGRAPRIKRYKRSGRYPPFVARNLTTVIPVGERNTTIYRLAKDLFIFGHDFEEILSLIYGSPTYSKIDITKSLDREVRKAVENGISSAEKDLSQA